MENVAKSNYKKLVIDSIIFALGSFGSKIISFFLVPLYTHCLNPDEYGLVDLLMTIGCLILPIIILNINEAVLFYSIRKPEAKEKVLKNSLVVLFVGSVALICLTPLFSLYDDLKGYSVFITLYTILSSGRTILQIYTKSRNKNLLFSIDSIIYSFSIAILNILFLLVFKYGINGFLMATLISEIISFIFLSIVNRGVTIFLKEKIDKKLLKEMIIYSAPLIINSVCWSVIHLTDKVMLREMIGEDSAGIYSASSKIPNLINTITNFFTQAWALSSIAEIQNKDTKFYENVFKIFNFLLVIVTSIVLFVLKPFMSVYVGKDFFESWLYVPVLLFATVFYNYSSYFGTILISCKKSIQIMVPTVVGAILNIFTNYLLIIKFGIQGAAVSTLICYIIISMSRLFLSRRYFLFHINFSKFIISLICLLIQTLSVIFEFYNYFVSFVIILVLILMNLKEIKIVVFKIFKKNENKKNC